MALPLPSLPVPQTLARRRARRLGAGNRVAPRDSAGLAGTWRYTAAESSPDQAKPRGERSVQAENTVGARSFGPEQIARNRDRVFRFILKSVGDYGEAEDLTQKTLLEALRNWQKFGGRSAPTTWLLGIAANIVRSHYRSRSRNRPVEDDEVLANIGSDDVDQEEAASQRQRFRLLQTEMAKLPEEWREALLLVSLEGMSYEEAAEALDVPIGTIRSRISRARSTLRERLAAAEAPRTGATVVEFKPR